MKIFNYNALDEAGLEQSGFIQGDDKTIAVQQLRQRGLYVVKLEEDEQSKEQERYSKLDNKDAWTEINDFLPVKTANKIFFFKQLALMIRSGISITESLDIIGNMQKGRMRRISMLINKRIKSGDSFSKAIEPHQDIFSNVAVQMIRSSETSGEIDIALLRIVDYMQHRSELSKQVITAMMYPLFTLLAACGVFVFLMVFIIPKFESFLAGLGKQAPASTQLMIDVSAFLSNYWLFILMGIIAFMIAFYLYYRKPDGRLNVDRGLLSIPIIGGTVDSASMAQIGWGLSMLLKSGIPVVEALRIISDMTSNQLIAKEIEKASNDVLQGKDLAKSFDRAGINPLLHKLMIVGERSGNLVALMEEATEYYEDDLKTKTKTLAGLVEPISIILIGGIVGFIYYGFFQAVLSLTAGA